jgi:hypothetical protein
VVFYGYERGEQYGHLVERWQSGYCSGLQEEEEDRFVSNAGVGGSNPPLSAATLLT